MDILTHWTVGSIGQHTFRNPVIHLKLMITNRALNSVSFSEIEIAFIKSCASVQLNNIYNTITLSKFTGCREKRCIKQSCDSKNKFSLSYTCLY